MNLGIVLFVIILITIASLTSFGLGTATAFRVCADEARKFIDIDRELILEYLETYRERSGWYGLSNGTAE